MSRRSLYIGRDRTSTFTPHVSDLASGGGGPDGERAFALRPAEKASQCPAGKAGPVTGQLIEVSDLAKRYEATVGTVLKVSDLAQRCEATVGTVLDGSAAHPRRRPPSPRVAG
jgi:hypothetical protein